MILILIFLTIIIISILIIIIIKTPTVKKEFFKKKKLQRKIFLKQHQEICSKILKKFTKILDNNNIEYSLIYGTLLGAVRENKFIDHDDDIDIGLLQNISVDKLNDVLFNTGLKCIKSTNCFKIDIDDGSINRSEWVFDIFIPKYTSLDGLTYCFPTKKETSKEFMSWSDIYPLKKIKFGSSKYRCFNNPEKFLASHYGKDWRIPKITHSHFSNKSLINQVKKRTRWLNSMNML